MSNFKIFEYTPQMLLELNGSGKDELVYDADTPALKNGKLETQRFFVSEKELSQIFYEIITNTKLIEKMRESLKIVQLESESPEFLDKINTPSGPHVIDENLLEIKDIISSRENDRIPINIQIFLLYKVYDLIEQDKI